MRLNNFLKTAVLFLVFTGIGESSFASVSVEKPEAPSVSADGTRFTDRNVFLSSKQRNADVWCSMGGMKLKNPGSVFIESTMTISTWAVIDEVSSDTLTFNVLANEPQLTNPLISILGVDGPNRKVEISTPDKYVDLHYIIDEDTIAYYSPFLVSDTVLVSAFSSFVDELTGDTGVSPTSSLLVEAGEAIKLNPVVFSTYVYDLSHGQTAVKMSSNTSDFSFLPNVRIKYRNSVTMSDHIVPNDTTIITPNTTITAFAFADGFLNSDTTTLDVQLVTLKDITAPKVKFVSANSDGSRTFEVKNTTDGYPVPNIYYYTEGVTSPKLAANNQVVIPTSERGWVHFYADADGFDPSPEVIYYVDSRAEYKEPYKSVTPTQKELPTSAGDLEFASPELLNIEEYPDGVIVPTGYTYYHKKVHANFNDLVLPFPWNNNDNIVTDSKGNRLVLGEDFWLYTISTTLSAQSLASGSQSVSQVSARKPYLIKVKPELYGEELIFKSTVSNYFYTLQTDFTQQVALNDYIIKPNVRYQNVEVPYTMFTLNSAGTAFTRHEGGIVYPFTTMLIVPYSFMALNDSIDLIYHPSMVTDPTTGSTLQSLKTIGITVPGYPKLTLSDPAYLVGGTKSIPVYRNGSIVTYAQFEHNTTSSYSLVLNSMQSSDGIYKITIPGDLIEVYKNVNDVEPFASVGKKDLQYTILSEFVATANPSPGTYTSLSTFKITFNKNITLNDDFQMYFARNGVRLYTFGKNDVTKTSNSISVVLPELQTAGGLYELRILYGSFTIADVLSLPTDLPFEYTIQAHRERKFFDEEEIVYINQSSLDNLFYQGWIYSDSGSLGENFSCNQYYNNYLDPETDQMDYMNVGCMKISTEDDTHLNMDVAGVDSLVVYYINPGALTFTTNVTLSSTSSLEIIDTQLTNEKYKSFPMVNKQFDKYEIHYDDIKNLLDGNNVSLNNGGYLKFLFTPEQECDVTIKIHEWTGPELARHYEVAFEKTITISNGAISTITFTLPKQIVNLMKENERVVVGEEDQYKDLAYIEIITNANVVHSYMKGSVVYSNPDVSCSSTVNESVGQGIPVGGKSSEKGTFRLNRDCAWNIKLWGYVNPVYVYAVKFITDCSQYAGIEDILIDDDIMDGYIYNIRGEIVDEIIPGQLYIKNGKKFMIQ